MIFRSLDLFTIKKQKLNIKGEIKRVNKKVK